MRNGNFQLTIDRPTNQKILNAVQADDFKLYVKNAKDDDPAELLIFEQIGKDPWFGDGVGAKDVASFLAQNKGKPVNVRINSPGGLAFDGVTIHNALFQHDAQVTTTIEGIAASAASVIAFAGQPVRMFANASLMVHRALCVAIGNMHDMADVAEWLDKLDQQIALTMSAKSGRKKESMLKLMDGNVDGTWFTAEEALKEGLIDEIIPLKDASRGNSKNAISQPAADGGQGAEAQALAERLQGEARTKQLKARADRRLRLMEINEE